MYQRAQEAGAAGTSADDSTNGASATSEEEDVVDAEVVDEGK